MQQMEAELTKTMVTILQNGVMGKHRVLKTLSLLLLDSSITLPSPTLLSSSLSDFYEEMLALLDLFTSISISPAMWQMLFVVYDTFTRDGFDFFTGTSCVYVL